VCPVCGGEKFFSSEFGPCPYCKAPAFKPHRR
jgi:hypothetical protein